MEETEEIKAVMMCWENSEGSLVEEPGKETDNQEGIADNKMQNQKDEEEHVDSTLHTGNQLKISSKEFSWGMEDDALMLDTQETAQQQVVYITNLEKDLQNHGREMNEEEGPKDKRPVAKNRPLERPSLIYLNHGSKIYEESGSENDNAEEIERGKNMKNMKEIVYTNISSYERGEWAKQQKIEKPKNDHKVPRNQEKNEKALVTKEMTLSSLGENIFMGDSAATSHMTCNKK